MTNSVSNNVFDYFWSVKNWTRFFVSLPLTQEKKTCQKSRRPSFLILEPAVIKYRVKGMIVSAAAVVVAGLLPQQLMPSLWTQHGLEPGSPT